MVLDARIPSLTTDVPVLDEAFRLAVRGLLHSIAPYQGGVLDGEEEVFLAGAWYFTPWTRDASINIWNGAALLYPTVARDTLRSVLERREGRLVIGGQYWDAVIWAIGAWAYYRYTGDKPFLAEALEATRNTLALMEASEFSADLGLFRGPAVYGDGVAAYPDAYARTEAGDSSIERWATVNRERRASMGAGLPMHALSTNCLYVGAYRTACRMAAELGQAPDPSWGAKAQALTNAINTSFWMPDEGRYRYLIDPLGNSDAQEGLGSAFAVLFGVANREQAAALIGGTHVTPAGVPCVWPSFDRYAIGDEVGRHSGTVWPPVQALWAEAAASTGDREAFGHELFALAEHAVRDGQFYEIYHPETTLPYGGLQERRHLGITSWSPMPHQTWSATAYLRMTLGTALGLQCAPDGITVAPALPPGVTEMRLTGLTWRSQTAEPITLDVTVRSGQDASVRVDGQAAARAFLPATAQGRHTIDVVSPPHAGTAGMRRATMLDG